MRFWAKVIKTDDCWNWTGLKSESTKKLFYGVIKIGSRRVMVHRLSYEMHRGPIPEGKQVCHHCDNGLCVRPDHLFLGTQRDNVRDMISKGRQIYGRVVLTQGQIREIKSRYVPYCRKNGAAALAKEMGLKEATVYCVAAGKRWKHSDDQALCPTKARE